ncbi:lysophospholipid acyltransferase family protein [Haloflavibacter putidus]|uniref:1-acyl-sn-glycerol-3-phosphate acyltransferase n=1 Tax=Haloflavibacter putidus TaxID=2576776 RepID=A0A508A447_9FLAO|nr:lysophospholipid acyltransferase family protein [Haloflavibacter putidus]TQD40642.1 1-acyl-sn-glycerol-3-phosphate acyltransferase [Haloflavibacter putidus]
MKWIKAFFILLYRMWFYILVAVPIIVLFPLLLVSTLREKFYPFFFKLARLWAKIILYGMGFYPIVKRLQRLQPQKSYMLVANHTSMADIMLMLAIVKKPFVFVGKKELAKFPVFGFFYKRTCILVDRKNTKSRQDVFYRAQRRLKQGNSICIFPEGGVPDDLSLVLDSFKDGAFRLAIEHKIPVVPMVFYDNKKRFSYSFFNCSPGKMRVKILNFINTGDLKQADKRALREKTRSLILESLQKDDFKKY